MHIVTIIASPELPEMRLTNWSVADLVMLAPPAEPKKKPGRGLVLLEEIYSG